MSENDAEKSPYAGLAEKIRGGKSASTVEFESRNPQIKVIRNEDGDGFRGLLRIFSFYELFISTFAFSVSLNDQAMGRLFAGESIELEGRSGSNDLLIRTPVASASLRLTLENGMRTTIACCPTFSGISLRRVD